MALLTLETRKKWFLSLGLGTYNKTNIRKFQKKYFVRSQDIDGLYGPDTDRLLRHVHHVSKYMKNFVPEEFRCGCKGKYCTGYPTWLRVNECKNIQAIRSKYGKPMTVTSGLRCKTFNNNCLRGSSPTSRHMTGRAVDFYIPGVTDTLSGRKKVIKYAKKLKNFHYAYGDGYNSYGYSVNAPNMGNAVHADVR